MMQTLYMDSRIVATKINQNRLLHLFLDFLEWRVSLEDFETLGLNKGWGQ